MTRLASVCRYIRSKNAGPFWITVDLFFADRKAFDRHSADPALSAEALALALGAEPASVRRFELPELAVLKFSYPRLHPQGGVIERDMHGGQYFADLLDLEIGSAEAPSP